MEGQALVEVSDAVTFEQNNVASAPQLGKRMDLMTRDSLTSIKHPLSGDCARHGGDFLPSELLANLTNQFDGVEDLGPQGSGRLRRGKMFPKVYPKRPPDNVWNHARTREKFKHLTEQPPCTCGAGRDISFLYDAVSEKKISQESPTKDKKDRESKGQSREITMSSVVTPMQEKISASEDEASKSKPVSKNGSQVPETLLPSEFHIVKNPGVMGLEMHDEKYTTIMDNHEKHLTLFPSMKPSGRQEAVQLKKTMDDLLARAGMEETEKDSDQPTQLHTLLDLVKQEQNIYNIVFNEVIRQVSIECVERGELLADLRKRYAKLLDKVPRQVKSLHEEVLAQRALDRRLTEELTRFKTSITLLTRELDEIQQHDREVTQQAIETQNELNLALKESEKNASLLAEYHELYELQRRRLETQISMLIEERDLWSGASYTMSLKVYKRHNFKTAKRLHLHEKAWYKLSSHFSVVLSDMDSVQLQELTNHVQLWQDVTEEFDSKLLALEKETYKKLNQIQKQVRYWGKQFEKVVPDESTVHPPEPSTISKLCEDIKKWDEVFNTEIERFSGDVLLSSEDDLLKMTRLVDDWSDVASKIFRRHPTKDGTQRPEHEALLLLNLEVDKLHRNIKLRMTGENGLAKGMIHLINVLDSVGEKLNSYSKGGESLLDPEWIRVANFLQDEWMDLLSDLMRLVQPRTGEKNLALISPEPSMEDLDVEHLSASAQKWLTDSAKSIENEDASLLDHVSSSHSYMVRWMVTILLQLAPDLEEDPLEDLNEEEDIGIGAAIMLEATTEEIKHRAQIQFKKLRRLTNNLFDCCVGVVSEPIIGKQDLSKDIAEVEARDLKKMKVECNGWIKTAILLVEEFSGDIIEEDDYNEVTESEQIKTSKKDSVGSSVSKPPNEIKSTTPASLEESTTYSREPSVVVTTPASERTEGEHSTEKVDNVSPQAVEAEQTEIEKNNNEVEVNEQGEDSKGGTDSKGGDEPKNDDVVQMHVIGHDDNMKVKILDQTSIAKEITSEKNKSPESDNGTYLNALGTIDKLQLQLVETEERAQTLEERAITSETQLKEALERIRALERTARRGSQDDSEHRPTRGRTPAPAPVKDKSRSSSRSRATTRWTKAAATKPKSGKR